MTNSLYEVPTVLQDYVLAQRGLSSRPMGTTEIRQHREALETLRRQWSEIVDNANYGQINDLMGIRRAENGHLVVTYAADHRYSEGALIAVPYRFVNAAQVDRYFAEYLGWLEVTTEEHNGIVKQVRIKPAEGTSRLRIRAFAQAVFEAKEQLGALLGRDTSSNDNPQLTIDGIETYINGTYHTGVQVAQLYWGLAVMKDIRDNLTELMRAALKATRTDATVTILKRDTSSSFESFFQKRRNTLKASADTSIENLPMIDPNSETPRTWGIEVEAAGARGIGAPGDWDRKGDGSLRSAYTEDNNRTPENCPEHDHDEEAYDEERGYYPNPHYEDPEYCDWLNYDYDDYDDYGSNGDTAEFVSPILNHGGDMNLKELVEKLSTQPQNDSAGVHVHVGAEDLNPRQLGALVFAYSVIEPLIEKAYRRNTRNYCRERDAQDVLKVVRSSKKPGVVKTYENRTDQNEVLYYGDRYVSVNLSALEAHGTVEFRAMGPVYEYEHLIKWALFCREMVSIAKLNLPVKTWTSIKSWKDLSRVLHTYGPELQEHTLANLESYLTTDELEEAMA